MYEFKLNFDNQTLCKYMCILYVGLCVCQFFFTWQNQIPLHIKKKKVSGDRPRRRRVSVLFMNVTTHDIIMLNVGIYRIPESACHSLSLTSISFAYRPSTHAMDGMDICIPDIIPPPMNSEYSSKTIGSAATIQTYSTQTHNKQLSSYSL